MPRLKKQKTITLTVEHDGDSQWKVLQSLPYGGRQTAYSLVRCKEFDACDGDVELILKLSNPLRMVSQNYYDHYKSGDMHIYEGKDYYLTFKQAVKAVKEGQYHLILSDAASYDGFFYDVDGKPILRPIVIDDIYVHVATGLKPIFDKALDKAKKHSKVTGLKVVDVPYYNRDRGDCGQSFRFCYLPTEAEFRAMIKKTTELRDMCSNEIVKTCINSMNMNRIVWDKVVGKNFVDKHEYERRFPEKYKEIVGEPEPIWDF